MSRSAILVLGGARSGKSAYAEMIAEASTNAKTYIATAQPADGEMEDRINAHRAQRGGTWTTVEAPLDLVGSLGIHCDRAKTVLVDCLTLWLSNQFMNDTDVDQECRALSESVSGFNGLTIFVSNEVGSGIVPDNALGRRFRDAQGRLNQQMAAACDTVILVVAGLPMILKGQSPI